MQCFIPSKDRPAQLHLLLESIRHNCPKGLFDKITILYKSTDFEYEDGYSLVKRRFQDLPLIWQRDSGDFYRDFVKWMGRCDDNLMCGICDDCLFYRPLPLAAKQHIDETMSDDSIYCFAFRLGFNTNLQYYITGQKQRQLSDLQNVIVADDWHNGVIKWNWKIRKDTDNYGYGFSLDGHIYRTKEMLSLTKKYPTDCLRNLEGVIAGKIRNETNIGNMMAGFFQSCLYSTPFNCCQSPPLISGQKYPYSLEYLNNLYLRGYIIDYYSIQKTNVDFSHNEMPLTFMEYHG
jgi:hypothetical protein